MWKHPSCTFPLLSWVIRLLFSSPSIPFHSTHSLFASQVLYFQSRLSVAGNHRSFYLEPFLEFRFVSSGFGFYWRRSLQAVGWGSSCWGWCGITGSRVKEHQQGTRADVDKRQQSWWQGHQGRLVWVVGHLCKAVCCATAAWSKRPFRGCQLKNSIVLAWENVSIIHGFSRVANKNKEKLRGWKIKSGKRTRNPVFWLLSLQYINNLRKLLLLFHSAVYWAKIHWNVDR